MVKRLAKAMVCGAAVTAALSACHKPLFPKDQPRNQFEIYDRMRNSSTQLTEPDEFGNPRPALRARLSQPQ